jgi:superfamily II DNA helicase RecQ
MQFRVFSITAAGDLEAEEEFNRFLRSHRVVSVQKQLVVEGGSAHWCFCVEYLLGPQPTGAGGKGRSRVDYKEVLSEADFVVFARLRDVRKDLAAGDAIPVYAVCTNEQLAEMARGHVTTMSELKKIDGFGEAKAAKYGEALLAGILNERPEGLPCSWDD